MVNRKKVITTVYFTPAQIDGLRSLSDSTRVPMAEYIRLAVTALLETHGIQTGEAV